MLVFVDGGKYSTAFLDILAHPFIGKDTWAKVAYAKVTYEKGSDLAKAWKVRKAPTMVVIDNTGESPKALRTLRGGSAQSIKSALLAAIKKVTK